LVNFIISPLVAVVLARTIPLQPDHETGLLALSVAAGGPFLPTIARAYGGDVTYAAAITVILIVGSLVLAPFLMSLLLSGTEIYFYNLAESLVLFMLVPVSVGMMASEIGLRNLASLIVAMKTISNIVLTLLIVMLFGFNFQSILDTVGSLAMSSYALYLLAIIGIGYFLGAIDVKTQNIFALGAGSRNFPAALILVGPRADTPGVTVMLIAALVVNLIALLVLARVMRRR